MNSTMVIGESAAKGAGAYQIANKSFISASVLISAVRFLGRGTSFAAALVASRHLAPADFGVYAYVITFLTAINLIGGLGLEQVALIHLSRARARHSATLLEQVLLWIGRRAIMVLPVASVAFAVPFHAVLGSSAALLYVIATGMCFTAILLAAGLLRGLDKPLASSVVQEAGRGPAFLLGAAALYFGYGLDGVWVATFAVACVFAIAAVIVAVLATRQARSEYTALAAVGNANEETAAPAGQLRFLLVLFATNAFLWICPVLLKRSAPISQVGLFNVAMQFPALISFISTSLEMTYVPKIATYWHAGRLHDIRPLIRTGSRLTLIAGLPVILVLVAFGGPLLSLYGRGYDQALSAMLVIVAAQAISVACGPCGYLVLLTGREGLNLAGMAAGAVSGIVCVAVLAGIYGHFAAALGFLIATSVSNVFFAVYCIKRLNINPTLTAAFQSEPALSGRHSTTGVL